MSSDTDSARHAEAFEYPDMGGGGGSSALSRDRYKTGYKSSSESVLISDSCPRGDSLNVQK